MRPNRTGRSRGECDEDNEVGNAIHFCLSDLWDPTPKRALPIRRMSSAATPHTNATDDILADDDAMNLWIRQTIGTARHVSGTCKMGPDSDPMAVVDQYCRVKGVKGLSVVDASVKPRITRSGGSHATVIMIGERAAGWIASA